MDFINKNSMRRPMTWWTDQVREYTQKRIRKELTQIQESSQENGYSRTGNTGVTPMDDDDDDDKP
jgi:hypothetical protein